jgi:hypothetical protein
LLSRWAALRDGALAVLKLNDLGDWTKPAPRLYPHQWSWDSAFIAIGLAHVDADRALRELESLYRGQWQDGRLPHIVFNPEARDYFPGPERWACTTLTPLAPGTPETSGLVQPPIHALALERMWQVGDKGIRQRIRALMPATIAWHRYLATARDPDGSGLISIYHPWESGTDNSPRWDAALARIAVGDVPAYVRHDLKYVADASERPTMPEYDRYLWLVELLKSVHYDDAAAHRTHPFLIKDALMTAIFAAANAALARLCAEIGDPGQVELAAWGRRAAEAVLRSRDEAEGLALDWDTRADAPVRVRTCAGLAPLLLPDLPDDVLRSTVEVLSGSSFAGAPGLIVAGVPSTAPESPGFVTRAYWRGPIWPMMNWLLWWGLTQHDQVRLAADVRQANLDLLARPGARFAEYFEPYTGEPLGSLDQSWSAAVALDWLA